KPSRLGNEERHLDAVDTVVLLVVRELEPAVEKLLLRRQIREGLDGMRLPKPVQQARDALPRKPVGWKDEVEVRAPPVLYPQRERRSAGENKALGQRQCIDIAKQPLSAFRQ